MDIAAALRGNGALRLLILLIVLGIGALLIAQQLRKPNAPARGETNSLAQKTPQIPTTPQGLPTFKKSINQMVQQDSSKEKALIRKESQ